MQAFRDSGVTNHFYDLHRYVDVGRYGLLRHCVLICVTTKANPWWRPRYSSILLAIKSSEIPENDLHEEVEIFAIVY